LEHKILKMKVLQATSEHIEAILQLQEKYHVSNLTEAEKQEKGFVTMRTTMEQLSFLTERGGIFVAVSDDNQLAAYALTSNWLYYGQWPITNRMEAALPTFRMDNHIFTTENSFHYGPVCIDEAFRGQDILTQFFEAILPIYAPHYPFVITFINKQNVRSVRAHARRTPLSIVGEFDFNGNYYFALASKTE
jgi:hypothetical protein